MRTEEPKTRHYLEKKNNNLISLDSREMSSETNNLN